MRNEMAEGCGKKEEIKGRVERGKKVREKDLQVYGRVQIQAFSDFKDQQGPSSDHQNKQLKQHEGDKHQS